MERSLIIIILIMLISGTFGGLINYFINNEEKKKLCILYGLAASFMVPLFLNMISSNLLEQIHGSESKPGDPLKYFVFTGFCLVAAISSRTFIKNMIISILKKMDDEIKHTKNDVSNVKDIAELVLAAKTEVDQGEEIKGQLSDDQIKVLKTMVKGEMVLRTIKGIAKDADLPHESVKQAINGLISKGLVRQHEREGGPRWVITLEGRKNVPNN
jgi:hypothetical protein